ncbi:MAG: DMT family transporter [Methanomassiliicoccales archaeon]|nr:MAG: DMT family transporter [Methanomassiliicoccales archaeon]
MQRSASSSTSSSQQNLSNMAILIAVFSVSFSAIFIRWSNAHPFVIAAYRMGITCLFLLPLVAVRYKDEFKKIQKDELIFMVAIGMVLALHFGAWISSLEETSVASSVILVTSHPLFVAIVSHYLFRERLKTIGYIGIVVAFIGIIVLSVGDLGLGGSNFRGDILALIGSIAAGTYILGGRKSRRNISLVPYVFIVYGVCTVCLLGACAVVAAPLYPLPLEEYELFILMALIPTILGHTLYNYALKYVKAQIISVSLLGEPIGSTILAWILLEEVPPQFTIIGGCLILPGIYLAYMGRKRKNERNH